MSDATVSSAHLPQEEKAKRSGSFGAVASLYERYRPGPAIDAVEWMLPDGANSVIDLGAGTGALTRLLVGRVDEVVAVEPDDRMRAVLTEQVPGVRAVKGRGDAMPLPDASADAVLASASWHWMDVVPTLREVARVLRPGGTLGAVWAGPDPEGPFMVQAIEMMRARSSGSSGGSGELSSLVGSEADRPFTGLEIPDGAGFAQPEYEAFRWDVALTADDLIGLLSTFSWVITIEASQRERLFAETRRLLAEILGVEGDVTVDVTWRADTYRTHVSS